MIPLYLKTPPTPVVKSPEVGYPAPKISMAAKLPELNAQPVIALEPVVAPAPTPDPPPTTAGDCVTGYSTGEYALDQIISHESGGRSCATNAGGCFGLLQACPGAPLKAACGGDPVCQIAWFKANKTGGRSWDAIWALWQTQGWW